MGNTVQPEDGKQERTITACPLCGESLPISPRESPAYCPSCEFNLDLLRRDEKPPVPQTEPAYVPKLVFWLIGAQIVISGIFAVAFLFFSAPIYLGTPQLIAALHFLTIFALGLFALFLYLQKGITIFRIGLMALGVVSLPPGVLSIAAAFAISPLQRWCIICGNQIKWVAHIECPHCQASMHRWGSCRNKRLTNIAESFQQEALSLQIEFTCPNCFKFMQLDQNEEKTND